MTIVICTDRLYNQPSFTQKIKLCYSKKTNTKLFTGLPLLAWKLYFSVLFWGTEMCLAETGEISNARALLYI